MFLEPLSRTVSLSLFPKIPAKMNFAFVHFLLFFMILARDTI